MSELSRSSARVAGELERLGIGTTVLELPGSTRTAGEAADAVGCDVGQIVKSLVFRVVERDEPLLVLTSGRNRVDESKLAAVVGAPVERASAEFVRQRTGYAIGGVPPLGHLAPIATVLDPDLLAYEVVWAAAGTPRSVFAVAPETLRQVTSAKVAEVAG